MSEPKKQSEILQEQIDSLKTEIAELKKPQSSKTSTHEHTHKDVFDCPTCGATYLKAAEQKLRPKFEAEQREKQKKMRSPELCEDCGEVYDGEETDDCPGCRGKSEQ